MHLCDPLPVDLETLEDPVASRNGVSEAVRDSR